jgi:hypothetical protein
LLIRVSTKCTVFLNHLSYQAIRFTVLPPPQLTLVAEQFAVADEHPLLWLLPALNATEPIDDPDNLCSAKILFILSSFHI